MRTLYKNNKERYFLLFIFLFSTTLLTIRTFKKVQFKDIIFSGSQIISQEDIVNNSSINFPSRLIFIKTKFIEEELKKNLSLEKISINRQIIPFGLNISIKKRKPVAYGERLKDGKNLLGFIDKNGHFITEKYSDKDYTKGIKIKVFGWEEKYRDLLAEILNSSNTEEVELKSITFSKNGFLTLEEKDLKTIVLGFNSNIIKKQILIIKNLKKQLVQENIKEKILNIDLTDPNNPKIKVFKP